MEWRRFEISTVGNGGKRKRGITLQCLAARKGFSRCASNFACNVHIDTRWCTRYFNVLGPFLDTERDYLLDGLRSTVPVYMSREHEIIIWFLGGFCFYGPYRWTFTQSSSWNPGNLLVAGRQRWGLPQILDGQPSSQPMGQNMGLSHIIGCRMMRGVWKIIWRHLPYIKISYQSRI